MTDATDLTSFYDRTPFGLLIVARDRQKLRILYANATMKQWLMKDWRALDDILGEPLVEIMPGKTMGDLAKALRQNRPPAHATVILGDRWLRMNIREEEWEGQRAYSLWADDVSSDKQAETELRVAIEEADAVAEAKSNFLATMSHEMRTPMQSVYGLLELIALEKPSQQILDMVSIAKTSASGLLEILDDILDLAKMNADKMDLDMFEVPIRTLTRGVLEALGVKVRGKDIQLIDRIEEDVPFVIVGDPKRLRQIPHNPHGQRPQVYGKRIGYAACEPQDPRCAPQPENGSPCGSS